MMMDQGEKSQARETVQKKPLKGPGEKLPLADGAATVSVSPQRDEMVKELADGPPKLANGNGQAINDKTRVPKRHDYQRVFNRFRQLQMNNYPF